MMLANLGNCFLRQKQPANALVCLDAALEMNPDSAKAHKIYTKAACALGDWEGALKHAQLALKIDFDDQIYETEKVHKSIYLCDLTCDLDRHSTPSMLLFML